MRAALLLNSRDIGGANSVMIGLASMLSHAQVLDVVLVTPGPPATALLDVVNFHGLDPAAHLVDGNASLPGGIDVHVVNSLGGARRVARVRGKHARRSIAVFHGTVLRDGTRRPGVVAARHLYAPFAGLVCGGLVAVDAATAAQVHRRAPWRSAPRVIANAVNPYAHWPSAASTTGVSLLYVGRLSHEKGSDRLLRIAREFAERDDEVTLTVQGRGPDGVELQHLAACLAARPTARFRLQLVEPGAPAFHAGRTVLLPSRQEGDPMVVKEAAACGLHVIASTLPATIGRPGVRLLDDWSAPAVLAAVDALRAAEWPRPTVDAVAANLHLQAYLEELERAAGR